MLLSPNVQIHLTTLFHMNFIASILRLYKNIYSKISKHKNKHGYKYILEAYLHVQTSTLELLLYHQGNEDIQIDFSKIS